MKHFLVLILLTLTLAGCSSDDIPQPTQTKSDIWLEMRFLHGDKTETVVVLLPKGTFNAIVSGEQKSGWLELKNVYWHRDGLGTPQEIAGKQWGYGKNYIIKIESIDRMIPLSEEAIRSLPSR